MKKITSRTKRTPKTTPPSKWSTGVTAHSNALDLRHRIFAQDDPDKIARSLKRSAQQSKRRKGTPYQSAMSMLNFYINRAGHNLPGHQLQILEKAKDSLREIFHKTEA